MASSETSCRGRFIKDFVEHSRDCERCAEAVLEGKIQCVVCGLAMAEQHMPAHMRLHTGEKPFRCAVCLEAFAQKVVLVRHLRRHANERPFACTACGKTFRQAVGLAFHRQSVHSSERPYACADCPEMFKLRLNLMAHKRRAHGYHYECRRCPAEFATRRELVEHYVAHRKTFLRGPTNDM